MPIELNWHDDDHSILRLDYDSKVTWEEYHPAIDEVAERIERASHRVDVILNAGRFAMPSGNPMPHIKKTAEKLGVFPNMGVIVVVNDSAPGAMAKMIVSTVYRIYGIDQRIIGAFVTTLDDAEASIMQERKSKASK